MSEDAFVARFRAGRVIPHSPMPWHGFQRMSDDDLRAIYRYLKTVPAVHRDVGRRRCRDPSRIAPWASNSGAEWRAIVEFGIPGADRPQLKRDC